MNWKKLLCPTRLEGLISPPPKRRAPARSTDPRTPFESDYDRAVFSTPVRRLQDKAQVFPLEAHDFVRTRLTHSLEVSTVARDLARQAARLAQKKEKRQGAKFPDSWVEDIATIAATCGLIHDLGNPPFGHFGEEAIKDWFDHRGDAFFAGWGSHGAPAERSSLGRDFLSFDGNAQTFRLLTRLQVHTKPYGLNLTAATLSAAGKYTSGSSEIDKKVTARSKLGHFQSERNFVEEVRRATGTGAARHPIAYLVEAADDIVYSTGDLLDGVKKGVVDWGTVKKEISAKSPFFKKINKQGNDLVKQVRPKLVGKAKDEALAKELGIAVVKHAVRAVVDQFDRSYSDIMSGTYAADLIQGSDAEDLIKRCKDIGKRHVYVAQDNLKLEVMGYQVIHDLLDLFWGKCLATDFNKPRTLANKLYRLMSDNYKRVYEQGVKSKDLPLDYLQRQLVVDYVCGMTDSFAVDLHHELKYG